MCICFLENYAIKMIITYSLFPIFLDFVPVSIWSSFASDALFSRAYCSSLPVTSYLIWNILMKLIYIWKFWSCLVQAGRRDWSEGKKPLLAVSRMDGTPSFGVQYEYATIIPHFGREKIMALSGQAGGRGFLLQADLM